MHNGYINVDNVKMSKSLGNFFTVRDVAEKYGYEPIRYLMISSSYRSPINYSVDIIEQCKASLQRLYTCRDGIDFEIKNAPDGELDENVKAQFDKRVEQFVKAMDDDSTPPTVSPPCLSLQGISIPSWSAKASPRPQPNTRQRYSTS